MLPENDIKALNILHKLIKQKTCEINEVYKKYLIEEKGETSEIKIDVSIFGLNNILSRTFLAIIDYKFDKEQILEWFQHEMLGKKSTKSSNFKNYVIDKSTLSLETLYHYYLLQNEFLKEFSKKEHVGFEPFIKKLKKPETLVHGVSKLPVNSDERNIILDIVKNDTKQLTNNDIVWALEFCEDKFFELSTQYEQLKEQSEIGNKNHIGFTETGIPVYTKSFYGKKYLDLSDERYYGRVYGVNEDNSPKEYLEPRGYEGLPYETEKEV